MFKSLFLFNISLLNMLEGPTGQGVWCTIHLYIPKIYRSAFQRSKNIC